ncbi:MAG: molybdopterin-dependent oxidoreductase [Vulcanisaeta sp.]
MPTLLRRDWDPRNPRSENRGKSEFVRISWDEALEIITNVLERTYERFGSMEAVLVQADGRGQSGAFQSIHFWGHYLFDKIRERLGWGWWTQQVRNPDSWEGYYWGAKHVWGFEETLGEPYQDAVWDDILEHAEMVILSGGDPESTAWGTSGSFAQITARWLRQAGIKIVAISPDLNYFSAVHADLWIPIKPNTDAALYLAIAYVWIKEGLYDHDYVKTHTIGFEEFVKYVLGETDSEPKTPEWAEKITGVPTYMIKALAREWARRRTSLVVYFGGPKVRGTYSHIVSRIEAYLMAMQGLGKPGRQFVRLGALTLHKKYLAQIPRYPEVDRDGVFRNPLIGYVLIKEPKSPSFVPRTLVADAILNQVICWQGSTAMLSPADDQFKKYCFPPRPDHPGIRIIWNENGSQANSWGYGAKWIKALRGPKVEFVVAIHPCLRMTYYLLI